MNLLIKSATISDPNNKLHGKKRDILIENGKITKIAVKITNSNQTKEFTAPELHVSKGWFDSSVSFGEPGYEERETIANGLNVAAKSGFTAIALNPNTNPVIDNKSSVEFLINSSTQHPVDLFPIANLTKGSKGLELAELYDMQQSGAIAFGDYNQPISNANLLKIALQYCQNFDGLTFSFPDHENISNGGLVNEGKISTKMGLKGSPALAEELQISRDLFLLEYTGGKLHIPTISTSNSVKLISAAKKKGLNVSCSVATHHLSLTDDELTDFNTNFKVSPPLRTHSDKKALINGVKTGIIDMIVSDHTPIDVEHKKVAFEHALDGTIGLENMFGTANEALGLDACLEALTTKPRERFGLATVQIEEGELANLTLFNPHHEYTFSTDDIKSTSKNSAFIDKNLKGKVYGIINNNKTVLSI